MSNVYFGNYGENNGTRFFLDTLYQLPRNINQLYKFKKDSIINRQAYQLEHQQS